MKQSLTEAFWRLTVFVVVCALGVFALFMVFAQLRFTKEHTHTAEFVNVSGLKDGDFVRIAGVEVGKIKKIAIRPDAVVNVDFSVDDTVSLSQATRALIRWDNVVGDRYLELQEGAEGKPPLPPGAAIPLDRTEPALDLDALIGGFRPLFRALDPAQVNALTGQLIQVFQGQGPAIGSFLTQLAGFTSTLADRGQLIDDVITNLNTVVETLSTRSAKLDKTITHLADTMRTLANRKVDISSAVAHVDAASASLATFLNQARRPVKTVVEQSDRATSIVLADHDYFDDLLNTLPDAYQALGRQGLYGDFFTFYLCEAVLKLNGKGGQPVYVRVANQTTGRCAPK